jgi:chemotaxis-related protein WspB
MKSHTIYEAPSLDSNSLSKRLVNHPMQLFLQIRTGDQGYLMDARHITRVLPLMRITSVPLAVGGVIGIINYQGSLVPVLDLCEILLHRPAARRVTTRLILFSVADFATSELSNTHSIVALLAEGVSDVIRLAPGDFAPSVRLRGAQCLGHTANVEGRLMQRIELAELLSPERLATLGFDSGNAA